MELGTLIPSAKMKLIPIFNHVWIQLKIITTLLLADSTSLLMKYSDNNNMSCHHRETSGYEQPFLPVKMQPWSSFFKPSFLNNSDVAMRTSESALGTKQLVSNPREAQNTILTSREAQTWRDRMCHRKGAGPTPQAADEVTRAEMTRSPIGGWQC